MTLAVDVAHSLLRGLLSGEHSDEASLYLGMLLEKSSPLANSAEVYRQILPPELADLELSQDASKEIISTVCAEIARRPNGALIAAISFTGADLPTKTAANLLISPPLPLSLTELLQALSLITKFLPYRLSIDHDFLSKTELLRLIERANELQNIEETGEGMERSARIGIRIHAAQLLRSLKSYGITES
jgi:hypothetical protein